MLIPICLVLFFAGSAATVGISIMEHKKKQKQKKSFYNPLNLQVGKSTTVAVLYLRNSPLVVTEINFIETNEQRITLYRLNGTSGESDTPYAKNCKIEITLVALRQLGGTFKLYLAVDSLRIDPLKLKDYDVNLKRQQYPQVDYYSITENSCDDFNAEENAFDIQRDLFLTLNHVDSDDGLIKLMIGQQPTLFGRIISTDSIPTAIVAL